MFLYNLSTAFFFFFVSDLSLLKQQIAECRLHPRSISPLSQILDISDCQDSCHDRLLLMLTKIEQQAQLGQQLSIKGLKESFGSMAEIPVSEWTTALLEVWTCCALCLTL